MFRKVHVPLLGLVENMSCFTCPNCGHSEAIFGEGGGAATAADLGIELLGQVSWDNIPEVYTATVFSDGASIDVAWLACLWTCRRS